MAELNIEAVTVSVGYADYLQVSLTHNLPHVDRMIVVTTPEDKETQEVCRRFGVVCRPTKLFYKDGDTFAKARGIDYGIGFLRQDSWILHFDADVVMPPMARKWLEWITLDEECIYGVDRLMCPTYEAWDSYRKIFDMQHDYWCRVNPPPFPIGARISIKEYGGFIPIGYWQLWHGKHGRRYPLFQSTAEHTDVLHALQWDVWYRRMIPEFFVVHLQNGEHKMGANWDGRKTPRFEPRTSVDSVCSGMLSEAKQLVNQAPTGVKDTACKLLQELESLLSHYKGNELASIIKQILELLRSICCPPYKVP